MKDLHFQELDRKIREVDDLKSQLKTKDALIKELIECVEFYGDLDTAFTAELEINGEYCETGGKKARTLLNSEAVKKWRGKK